VLRSLVAVLAVAAFAPSGVAAAPNPVAAENARLGTSAWTAPAVTSAEIYASEIGATPGDILHFHVSTAADARYRIEVYRLGWYGGAGGRLVACTPGCRTDEPGVVQVPTGPPPGDPFAPPIRARWPVTDSVTTSRAWPSGYYLARVVVTSGSAVGPGGMTYVILRSPPWRPHASILVQVPVNTWQAYNTWGGASLYDGQHPRSYHVSFDRPYSGASQSFALTWELPLVRFLERFGYDVSYQTDFETDEHPGSLLRHRLIVVAGHDEYWTKRIRDAFGHALRAGVNLAFVGANIGFWQMRYDYLDDGVPAIDEYRSGANDPSPDPATKTTTFRRLTPPRLECALLGVTYPGGVGGPSDYRVTAAAATDPWFAGTGFAPGDVLTGLVGGEWDTFDPSCAPAGTIVLFHGDAAPHAADAIRYTAPSGATVFSAGSLAFSGGFDDFAGHVADPRLQRFMKNAVDRMSMRREVSVKRP
jgi:hypothetical protein